MASPVPNGDEPSHHRTPASADDPGQLASFDYFLPPDGIAQEPASPRDAAAMLVPGDAASPDRRVRDLPQLLEPGDVLVLNDTKVRSARVHLRKPTGGAVEVLFLAPTGDPQCWTALVRPGKRLKSGAELLHGDEVVARIEVVLDNGQRIVRLLNPQLMEEAGELPLPPYIHRRPDDPGRYQTVYAQRPGSVAAPTAGLHLTHELLQAIVDRGITIARVELEVGLGTFAPITSENLDEHVMHTERYAVTAETWARIRAARRVVAVGTTSVRTLETVARTGELTGATDLFIRRGFDWQVVDVLLTNFHLPRSSLLVLLDAFIGPAWRELYANALDRGYRVGSFGDCMLLERLRQPASSRETG